MPDIVLIKIQKQFSGDMIAFSTGGAGVFGQKMSSNWIPDLNVKL